MNVLGTTTTRTSWTEFPGLVRSKSQVRELVFQDWTVDGLPLRELVTARGGAIRTVPEMARLCEAWPWPEEATRGLRTLLGETRGDFDDGRVALLVCPICADLGCRALSTALAIADDFVEWRNLAWQVDYQPFVPSEDDFDPPLSLRFDRTGYDQLLRSLLARYGSLAATTAPPAQRRRGGRCRG